MAFEMQSTARMTNLQTLDPHALVAITGGARTSGFIHPCHAEDLKRRLDGNPMTRQEFDACLAKPRDPNVMY